MRIMAVLAVVLAGCAYIGGPASPSPGATTTPTATTEPTGAPSPPPTAEPAAEPTPTPDNRDAQRRAQAEAALQHWADFMADKPSATIVFTVELTSGGGWRGHGADDAKGDFLSGMIEATVDLPTDIPPPGEVAWPDGTTQEVPLISAADAFAAMIAEIRGNDSAPECGNCLQVTGASLTTRTAFTWHGEAEVPVWQFEFIGRGEPMTPISFVAVRDRVGPGDWDAWPGFAPETRAAYGGPEDVEITVAFLGGACYRGPWFADAFESDLAVTVNIRGLPPTDTSPRPCIALGVTYLVAANLSSPLGRRAVIDIDSGFPVLLYPFAPPDGLRPG